jgi:hypothetical protein
VLWAVPRGHGASRPGLRSGGSEATGATREGRESKPHGPAGAGGPAICTVMPSAWRVNLTAHGSLSG